MSLFLSNLAGTLRSAFRVGRAALDATGLTAARTQTLPDKSGTFAFLDDVGGATGWIQATTGQQLQNNDQVLAVLTSPATFTLPGAPAIGSVYVLRNASSSVSLASIDPGAGRQIQGCPVSDTLTLMAGEQATLVAKTSTFFELLTPGAVGPAGAGGGGGSVAGDIGSLQYNASGVQGGAQRAGIHVGDLALASSATPTTPLSGTVKVIGSALGSLVRLAALDSFSRSTILQTSISQNPIQIFSPLPGSTTPTTVGLATATTGTAQSAHISFTTPQGSARRIEYAVTTASTTAVAGVRVNLQTVYRGGTTRPYGGFVFTAHFGPSRGAASNATRRIAAVLVNSAALPTDVDIADNTNYPSMLGVVAEAADTNFHIIHRASTGAAATKIDTGIPKAYADNTEFFRLVVTASPLDPSGVGISLTRLSDDLTFYRFVTSNIPADTTLLAWQIWSSVGGTSSVIGIAVGTVTMETFI